MLSQRENALLTRVGPDAPMGQMMRRYWLPACLSEELPEPDGTPLRLRLLGEDLVAFRDSQGRLGLLAERCPHRLASLALGRNEEGGLRCIYHGWKFDVDGRCLDLPTEPGDSTFKDRLRARSYPVREAGDIVWTYLGPPEKQPPFHDFDWITAPAEQRAIVKIGEHTNYLQAIEGSIDSAHSWFLHRGATGDWKKRSELSSDLSPRLETADTDYGFRYAATRRPNADPDRFKYVRVTLCALPAIAFIPRSLEIEQPYHVAMFAPVDDENTIFYGLFVSQDGRPVSSEKMRTQMSAVPGVDLDRRWFRRDTAENWYGQDREAMKNGDWCGIKGFPNQDVVCQESMGPVVDRPREHLGTSDVAIIRFRRRLLESLERSIAGQDPIGLVTPIPYERMRSEQKVIPIDQPWQTVGAFAGEDPAFTAGAPR